MYVGRDGKDRWSDSTCSVGSQVYSSFCRRTLGYTLASNGKYYRVLHALGKTNIEARALCEADGGRLAYAPYGQQEIKAMERFVSQVVGLQKSSHDYVILVDGTDEVTEGLWVLPNGIFTPQITKERKKWNI